MYDSHKGGVLQIGVGGRSKESDDRSEKNAY